MKAFLLLVTAFAIASSSTLAEPAAAPKEAKAASKPPVAAPKNVTPNEVEELLAQTPKPVVLDVRTPEEFAEGHIAGAKNISSNDPEFAQKVAKLDKKQPIIVHCAAGGRSGRSLPAIGLQNFPTIYHMNGGFNAWRSAGKPVEK